MHANENSLAQKKDGKEKNLCIYINPNTLPALKSLLVEMKVCLSKTTKNSFCSGVAFACVPSKLKGAHLILLQSGRCLIYNRKRCFQTSLAHAFVIKPLSDRRVELVFCLPKCFPPDSNISRPSIKRIFSTRTRHRRQSKEG